MSQKYANRSNLGLTLALWLSHDLYDHNPEDAPDDGCEIISVTTLLKPTKALILGHRIPQDEQEVDLADLVASRLGQATHSGIENAFLVGNLEKRLISIGVPANVAAKVVVNPDPEVVQANPHLIPVYLEKRAYRKIETSSGRKVWISGKFDQVIAGRPEDNKITTTYKYSKLDDTEKSDYGIQMSLYRWLNPDIITSDVGQINFVFKDWKRGEVGRMPNYPDEQVKEAAIQLMDEQTAEAFVRQKLDDIERNARAPSQADMTRCTDEELWRTDPVHKYYANPEVAKKGGRATKNFPSYAAAMEHRNKQNKGEVVTIPGRVRRCGYCDAAPACEQRREYIED